jgi:hypothetical protein
MSVRNRPRIGQELLDVPMGDMIKQMAFAIAEAQIKLDENSIEVAQMMGGLKTITDDNGNVIFEDSRVFFGKEKMQLQDAVEIHNLSSDMELRAQIRSALGSNYQESGLVDLTTNPKINDLDALIATSNNDDIAEVYKTFDEKFYKYKGLNTDATPKKVYEEVSKYAANISRIGALAPTSTVSLPQKLSMLELGFTPTFYQFVDTIIEVKISIRYSLEAESKVTIDQKNTSANLNLGLRKGRAGVNVTTTQVNATHSQKYSYSAEGASLMRTKLVPIPPPAILEDRIKRMLDAEFSGTK